jgi:hypothetical protein
MSESMHSTDRFIAPLNCLMRFAQSVHVMRMIEELTAEPKQNFWIMTRNLLFQSAAIEWCKVFGSNKDLTHWTKVLPISKENELRSDLLIELQIKLEDWSSYREKIVNFRDQMVAHHDPNAEIAVYPQFDLALRAAEFMFQRIRESADEDWLGGIPLCLDAWAKRVADHMRPIVERSFSASAVLGPNVLYS